MALGIAALLNPHWRDPKAVTTRTLFKKRRQCGRAFHRMIRLWTATIAFLKANGYRVEFDDIAAFSFLAGLYESGAPRFNELEKWLRQHTVL